MTIQYINRGARSAATLSAEIEQLKIDYDLGDEQVARLHYVAKHNTLYEFDELVRGIERGWRPHAQLGIHGAFEPTSGVYHATLGAPVTAPAVVAPIATSAEPDAWEENKHNPELPKLMKACKLSVANIREHGPRSVPIVGNLSELVASTNAKGE